MRQQLIDLVKQFEGCRLKAYQDVIGVWTIGYGQTGKDVYEGLTWTQEQAEDRLAAELSKVQSKVQSLLTTKVSAGQLDALTSFAYNVGLHALETSHLIHMVNEGDLMGASKQFLRWDKAGGKTVAGLTRRRVAEASLFLS